MSIAIRKFLSMLEIEIEKDSSANESQKKILKKLCEKIYISESTSESNQMPGIIREDIKFFAKDYEN